jgi:hypothetical protein
MNLRELFEALPIPIGPMVGNLVRGGAKAAGQDINKDISTLAKTAAKGQVASTAIDAVKEKNKSSNSIGIIFGRFNPPHKGHIKAWDMASENTAWYVGTNQDTQGPKDPLPFDVKIKVMRGMYPDLQGHLVAETSWLTLASYAFKKHPNIKTLFCYTDEEWVTKTVMAYNGKQGAHGFYQFENIEQKATPRLSSATDLRNAVQAGDRNAFTKAAGVPADTVVAGQPFFDLVSHYMSKYPVKIKEVNAIVRSLRESGTKKIDKTQQAAIQNAITIPALNMSTGSGGAYMNYRMGIALAGAPDYPTKMEADNWIGGDPLLSTYTQEEFEMIKQAAAQVGAGTIQDWSGNRSVEVADVNKTSAVAKPKRNKYGI